MANHAGHRDRLRKKIETDALEDHELLEVILYECIPRKNTNEIAHDLIDRFGSLSKVFCASQDELMTVNGVGSITASHLATIGICLRRCARDNPEKGEKLDKLSALKKYLVNMFIQVSSETLYLLILDNSKSVVRYEFIDKGYSNFTKVATRKIVSLSEKHGAASVIIAHNHPSGRLTPSEEDISFTHHIKKTLESLQIPFVDHFIVSGEECRPILGNIYSYLST